jgi:uncharacterized protein YkwD
VPESVVKPLSRSSHRTFWNSRNCRPRCDARHRRLVCEVLEDRQLLSVTAFAAATSSVPTAYDQYMLELINRARANPAAEAARDGIGLNEGLSAGTISTAAKQPLAFNPYLIASAQLHSQWMLNTDIFAHVESNGTDPGDRMTNAGYSFTGSWTWGENIAWEGTTGTLDVTKVVAQSEQDLFVDTTETGRGHRLNLMESDYREIGVGIRTGPFTDNGTTYNAVMTTQDFASSGSDSFLTGVVFDDNLVTANDFYTPGEGKGGVTISATRQTDNAVFTTTTWASGGYSLPLPAGTYVVTASGASLPRTYHRYNVTIGSQNVKVDFALAKLVTPTISITDVAQAEGSNGTSTFTFTVKLSATPDEAVSVNYATADGTATAGNDYAAVNGTLTWSVGVTSAKTISVTVYGDTTPEPDETFYVYLSSLNGAVLGKSRGVGTIWNDDLVSAVTVAEAAAPKNGKLEVNEKLKITWAASSTAGIVSQTLSVDGSRISPINGPYSSLYYSSAIGAWPAGSHGYTITATDGRGITSTSTGSFNVVTPPPPVIASIVVAEAAAPKNGQFEPNETLKITWAATSARGIASQIVTVDGKTITPISGPFGGLYYRCVIGVWASGSHYYTITATDKTGISSTSNGQFNVAAGPSICSVKVSTSGQSVSINWKIYAPSGVGSYALTIDGSAVTVTPPSVPGVGYTGAKGSLTAGKHNYAIKVSDRLGRVAMFSSSFTLPTSSAARSAVFSSAVRSGASTSPKVDWLYDLDELLDS